MTIEPGPGIGESSGTIHLRKGEWLSPGIPMHDAARALQTIRHRAGEWNIKKEKIAAWGGSAGAGISLWLAFNDDRADPDSEDPIARESTRLVAAGTMGGQSTYDHRTYQEWFGVPDLPWHSALQAFYGQQEGEDEDTHHDCCPRRGRFSNQSPHRRRSTGIPGLPPT